MKTLYFYAKTDNRLGLDRLRRTAALAKELQKEYEVYFMTTEFRSATYAKRVLGVKKAVGIEDFRNIGTICERGDIIVYDSDEHNEIIHQEMIEFFGKFIRISYDKDDMPKEGEILISPYRVGENIINGVLVDMDYFEKQDKDKRVFFYGDSDYEKNLLQIAPKLKEFDFSLLEGLYFFADIEDKVQEYFTDIFESEEYPETIQSASLFVSHSPQSALEAAASGAKTIYFGEDEEYKELFARAGVFDMGYFDAKRLQEALLQVDAPKGIYLRQMSVENVAKTLKKHHLT